MSETLSPTIATATGWANPTNVFSSNNVYATYTNTGGVHIPPLDTSGYPFNPTGVLLGIEISVEGKVNTLTKSLDITLTHPLKGAGVTPRTITLSTTEQYHTAGGPTDLWPDVLGADYLVEHLDEDTVIRISRTSGAERTLSIDHIRITVYYSAGATVTGSQPAASGSSVAKWFESLGGAQAAPSGALITEWVNKLLAGAQAAPSGALITEWVNKLLAGEQAAPSGTLFIGQTVTVEGAQPGASGTAAAKFEAKLVAGSQAFATGALAMRVVAKLLAGVQAPPSGRLEADFVRRIVVLGVGRGRLSERPLGAGRGRAQRPGAL